MLLRIHKSALTGHHQCTESWLYGRIVAWLSHPVSKERMAASAIEHLETGILNSLIIQVDFAFKDTESPARAPVRQD